METTALSIWLWFIYNIYIKPEIKVFSDVKLSTPYQKKQHRGI